MDTTILTDPWLWICDNAVPDDYCDHLIDKFEKEAAKSNTHKGVTGTVEAGKTIGDHIDGKSASDSVKQSDDFHMLGNKDWTEENSFLSKVLQKALVQYLEDSETAIPLPHTPIGFVDTPPNKVNLILHQGNSFSGSVADTGFQIQRTQPHHGYGWHTDFHVEKKLGIRIITFIFYLNTVREGWTQFWNGDQIQPQKGRILLFPSTSTYYHQGYPPLDTKYIITGWLHKTL